MVKQKTIHNLIILDESGSMGVIKDATISGFHGLAHQIISSGREFPTQDHKISLTTFSGTQTKFKLFNQPVSELASINNQNYRPDDTTPLYDAICKSVLRLKHELYNSKNYRALVTILTDGLENSSEEFSLQETKYLIETMSEDSRWGFGLIGANIDARRTAESLSIPASRAIEFEAEDFSVNEMFRRYRVAQRNMHSVFNRGGDFSDHIPF